MTSPESRALIRYRLGQAEDALTAARLLADEGFHREAVSRAYYATFYAVLALLAEQSTGTSKHSGAIQLFDRRFVKDGPFSREQSRTLHELFELRQRADYQEMFHVSPARTREAVSAAEKFVSVVRQNLADTVSE